MRGGFIGTAALPPLAACGRVSYLAPRDNLILPPPRELERIEEATCLRPEKRFPSRAGKDECVNVEAVIEAHRARVDSRLRLTVTGYHEQVLVAVAREASSTQQPPTLIELGFKNYLLRAFILLRLVEPGLLLRR